MKSVQEKALLHFVKRENAADWMPEIMIFQLVRKVCAYLHDQGFAYPKAAILNVIGPLSALIDSHIQQHKDHGISACSLADENMRIKVKTEGCL